MFNVVKNISFDGESGLKWVSREATREVVNPQVFQERSNRSMNLTPKRLACKCDILHERRSTSSKEKQNQCNID